MTIMVRKKRVKVVIATIRITMMMAVEIIQTNNNSKNIILHYLLQKEMGITATVNGYRNSIRYYMLHIYIPIKCISSKRCIYILQYVESYTVHLHIQIYTVYKL